MKICPNLKCLQKSWSRTWTTEGFEGGLTPPIKAWLPSKDEIHVLNCFISTYYIDNTYIWPSWIWSDLSARACEERCFVEAAHINSQFLQNALWMSIRHKGGRSEWSNFHSLVCSFSWQIAVGNLKRATVIKIHANSIHLMDAWSRI